MVDDPWAAYEKKPTQANSTDDPWASYTSKPTVSDKKKQESSYAKDLAYGVEHGLLEGPANTLRQEGYPNAAAIAAKAAKYVHDAAGLEGYDPSNGSQSFGDRVLNIPHSLVQGAPGMAQDVAAGAAGGAIGGPIGALLGFGGSYYLRNAGEAKDRVRASDGKAPDEPLSTDEQLRAAGSLGLDTLLGRFAIGKTLAPGAVKEVGLKAVPEITKNAAKAVGIDAGVGATQTAADDALLDKKFSLEDTALGALTGAAAGLPGSAPAALKETMRAGRFRELGKVDPQSRGYGANLLEHYGGDFDAVQKHIDDEVRQASKGLDPAVQDTIRKAKIEYGAGQRIDPTKIEAVRQVDPDAGQMLQNLDTFGVMRSMDNGGLSNTKTVKTLTPFSSETRLFDIGSLGVLATGGHIPYLGHVDPTIAAAILGTQAGVYGGARAIDRLSGASNPAKVITDKFAGGTDAAPTIAEARAATFARDMAQRQEQDRAAKSELDAAKMNALDVGIGTIAQRNVNNAMKARKAESDSLWKDAKESLRAVRNRDAIEARGPAGRGQDMGVDSNVQFPVSTDARLPLALARLKASLDAQKETQGPDLPVEAPTSSDLRGTPTGKLLQQALATERFNKRRVAEEEKAQKYTEAKTIAKAVKRLKDSEAQAKEADLDADPNLYVFEHRGQKIRPEKTSVFNPKAYETSFKEKTSRRMDVIDGAKSLTDDTSVHSLLDILAKDWTESPNKPGIARGHMKRLIRDPRIPKEVKDYLQDNWDRVKGTWLTERLEPEDD